MSKSKIFLYFCFSFVAGVFLSSLTKISLPIIMGLFISGIILISALWEYKRAAAFGFCLIFLVFGIWRYQSVENQMNNSKLLRYNEKEVVLAGFISDNPDIKEKSANFIFKTGQNEKILVTASKYPEYNYGDKLEIKGKLTEPPIFEVFNYQDYLRKERIYFVMNWPEIKRLEGNRGNLLFRTIFSFKKRFEKTAQRFIPPPQEGILEALVFGNENNIPKALKDKLNFTGTRHIAAVSGMNITIIASMILSLLLGLGFWRKQAFLISLFLIFLYILMIGSPASAVRAGIMAGLLMTAQYFGRMSTASRAVVFAATLMIFLNPFVLRYDVGFQLSFLAILGMVYFYPFFNGFLQFIPERFSARSAISMTLSAQIFTFPILLYNFGRISLISPFSNILIVPLLAPTTVLIFVFGLASIIFPFLGTVLSWPVWFLAAYIIAVVNLFSKVPFASLSFHLHWFWLAIFYLFLGYIAHHLGKKARLKFLSY